MKTMSLKEHLDELRHCMIWSLGFFLTGVVLAFIERNFFLNLVRLPHIKAMRNSNLSDAIYVFRYQDTFISQLKVCLVAGFVLSFPFILYHVLKFIGAGLFPEEKKRLLCIYLPSFLLLFLIGSIFSYFILIPAALKFLLLFGTQVGITPMIQFGDYISLFVFLMVISGLMFELPLAMALLVRVRVLSSLAWKKHRKLAILLVFVISAIVTPTPDPFTQCLLALPLIILYEVGCLLSSFIERKLFRAALPEGSIR